MEKGSHFGNCHQSHRKRDRPARRTVAETEKGRGDKQLGRRRSGRTGGRAGRQAGKQAYGMGWVVSVDRLLLLTFFLSIAIFSADSFRSPSEVSTASTACHCHCRCRPSAIVTHYPKEGRRQGGRTQAVSQPTDGPSGWATEAAQLRSEVSLDICSIFRSKFLNTTSERRGDEIWSLVALHRVLR